MIQTARKRWMRAATKLFAGDTETSLRVDQAAFPIELRERFLTDEEERLRRRLVEAIGDLAIVCPKTRLSDVVRIREAHNHLDNAVRIDRKFIDFLICHGTTRKPVCAVQLDQRIEATDKYGLRDEYLERALATAGLTVLHVQADKIPAVEQIRARLVPMLG